MIAHIYYVDPDKTTRDERWAASDGLRLPNRCYTRVAEQPVEWADPDIALERLFDLFQSETRGEPNFLEGVSKRSMSVGDLVVIEEKVFICERIGFRRVG